VGKSEQQVEYYELDSRIDNDHLPGNSFQFRLVACLEPDRLATLNFGDMMNQRGYAHLDSLDGVPFEMPFWMRQFDELAMADCTVHILSPMLCQAMKVLMLLMRRKMFSLKVSSNPSWTNLTNYSLALKLTSGLSSALRVWA